MKLYFIITLKFILFFLVFLFNSNKNVVSFYLYQEHVINFDTEDPAYFAFSDILEKNYKKHIINLNQFILEKFSNNLKQNFIEISEMVISKIFVEEVIIKISNKNENKKNINKKQIIIDKEAVVYVKDKKYYANKNSINEIQKKHLLKQDKKWLLSLEDKHRKRLFEAYQRGNDILAKNWDIPSSENLISKKINSEINRTNDENSQIEEGYKFIPSEVSDSQGIIVSKVALNDKGTSVFNIDNRANRIVNRANRVNRVNNINGNDGTRVNRIQRSKIINDVVAGEFKGFNKRIVDYEGRIFLEGLAFIPDDSQIEVFYQGPKGKQIIGKVNTVYQKQDIMMFYKIKIPYAFRNKGRIFAVMNSSLESNGLGFIDLKNIKESQDIIITKKFDNLQGEVISALSFDESIFPIKDVKMCIDDFCSIKFKSKQDSNIFHLSGFKGPNLLVNLDKNFNRGIKIENDLWSSISVVNEYLNSHVAFPKKTINSLISYLCHQKILCINSPNDIAILWGEIHGLNGFPLSKVEVNVSDYILDDFSQSLSLGLPLDSPYIFYTKNNFIDPSLTHTSDDGKFIAIVPYSSNEKNSNMLRASFVHPKNYFLDSLIPIKKATASALTVSSLGFKENISSLRDDRNNLGIRQNEVQEIEINFVTLQKELYENSLTYSDISAFEMSKYNDWVTMIISSINSAYTLNVDDSKVILNLPRGTFLNKGLNYIEFHWPQKHNIIPIRMNVSLGTKKLIVPIVSSFFIDDIIKKARVNLLPDTGIVLGFSNDLLPNKLLGRISDEKNNGIIEVDHLSIGNSEGQNFRSSEEIVYFSKKGKVFSSSSELEQNGSFGFIIFNVEKGQVSNEIVTSNSEEYFSQISISDPNIPFFTFIAL